MNQEKTMFRGREPAFNAYLSAKAAARGIPLSGTFELTSRCNFNCKMCYVHDDVCRGELSAEEWIELGRQAVEQGMVFLLLTGGEPLLRKDFKQIYSGLKKLGLVITVNTNGSLIDEDMLNFLIQEAPARMNISLYGACEETYRNLCGNRSFGKVVENIRRLRELGIAVKLNCSVTPYNVADIPEIYRIAKEIGVPVQATSYMFPPVRINGCHYGEAPHRFTPQEAAAAQLLCQEQYMTAQQLAMSFDTNPIPDMDCTGAEPGPMHCRAGKSSFWVKWNGNMLPCGMLPGEGYSIRDLGFAGAWEAVRQECREAREPAQCTECPKRGHCPACVASCLAESGDSTIRPRYVCEMVAHLDELKKEKYGGNDHGSK